MDDRCFRVLPVVRASVSPDGLVLLDVRGGVVLAANPVGARVWQLLEQRRTVAEIADQFADEYQISPSRAHRDVAAFVEALVARRLIAAEPAP